MRVRFRYDTHGYEGLYGLYSAWELDNVFLGNRTCQLIPGGLVEGTVTDANTGRALNDATVTSVSDPAETATTGPVPHPGSYELFASPAGTQMLHVSAPYYAAAAKSIDVAANKITFQNIALPAGKLAVTPAGLSATEQLGSRYPATGKITVTNTGTAPATVKLAAAPGGFTFGRPACHPADGRGPCPRCPAAADQGSLQPAAGECAPCWWPSRASARRVRRGGIVLGDRRGLSHGRRGQRGGHRPGHRLGVLGRRERRRRGRCCGLRLRPVLAVLEALATHAGRPRGSSGRVHRRQAVCDRRVGPQG